MSTTLPLPVVSTAPDPDRGSPDAPSHGALPRVGRLLSIVHKLVAYGTKLITTLQQGGVTERRAMAMLDFGTKDIALIVARIKCGLLRAAALQARLNGYVERGRDIPLPSERLSTPLSTGGTRTAAPDVDTPPRPARSQILALLPTEEEIAEQARTRSLGVVIGDICRDLGLAPGLIDGALWDELMDAVMECGIELIGLMRGSVKPLYGTHADHVEIARTAWPAPQAVVATSAQPP